jgi:hypothetical protein
MQINGNCPLLCPVMPVMSLLCLYTDTAIDDAKTLQGLASSYAFLWPA